jgi:hypothetical protein
MAKQAGVEMGIDRAIAALGSARTELPSEAMQWALDHWDEVRPRLIWHVDEYLAGTDRSDDTAEILFLGLHLAVAKNDKLIFEPLCRLLHDAEAGSRVLGDAITETLAGMLVGMFDGNAGRLTSLVDDRTIDDFIRGAALMAMAYLTHTGHLPEAATREFLRLLPERLDIEIEELMVSFWARAIAALGYQDFVPQVETMIGRLDDEYAPIDVAEFHEQLRETLADPTGAVGFEGESVAPLTDPIGLLSTWASFSVEDDDGRPDSFADEPNLSDRMSWDLLQQTDATSPYVNPLRHVGRNDPCPCGSGKKYKKCCLV